MRDEGGGAFDACNGRLDFVEAGIACEGHGV